MKGILTMKPTLTALLFALHAGDAAGRAARAINTISK
jgi:hypothetical protein